MKKRILSILLAMVMCMTLLPTVAMADEPVAQIGEKTYETLAKAIEAVTTTGAIIKLLANVEENVTIPAGKTLTLNLNGKTINGGTNSSTAAITNNGTLTITGAGTIKRGDTGSSAYYVIKNNGNLTFAKGFTGNVTNGSGSSTGNPWAGSSLIDTGTVAGSNLTINNGTFAQDNFIGIKNEEYGNLEINGGKFASHGYYESGTIACAVQNWGTAKITGGTFSGAIGTLSYGQTNKTEITGGTFTNTTFWQQNWKNDSNIPTLEITGGSFTLNANKPWAFGANKTAEITEKEAVNVSGGRFVGAKKEDLANYFIKGFDIDPNTGIVYSPEKVEQTVKTAVVVAVGVATAAVVTKVVVDKLHEVKAAKAAEAEAAEAAKLAEMPTVAIGDSGDAVTTLQTELNALGYDCGEADGFFGQNTHDAVIAFQAANGLTADGVVGAQTWGALL